MKKIIFGLVTLVIISLVIVKIFFLSGSKGFRSPISNSSNQALAPTSKADTEAEGLKQYQDPAGFKFSYPGDLTVTPQETDDRNIYSLLEIKSQNILGQITIKIEGSQLSKIDDYFKNKKINGVTKIKIADLDGRQFIEGGMMKTVALDQEVLITITTDFQKDKEFWSSSTAKIIASFAFSPPEENNSGASSSTSDEGDVILEEEEIIE